MRIALLLLLTSCAASKPQLYERTVARKITCWEQKGKLARGAFGEMKETERVCLIEDLVADKPTGTESPKP